jgi:hypothetical protein
MQSNLLLHETSVLQADPSAVLLCRSAQTQLTSPGLQVLG